MLKLARTRLSLLAASTTLAFWAGGARRTGAVFREETTGGFGAAGVATTLLFLAATLLGPGEGAAISVLTFRNAIVGFRGHESRYPY